MNLPVDPERALVAVPPQAGPVPPDSGDVDVSRLAQGLWRRRWRIVALGAALATLIGAPMMALRADVWQAEARFVVQPMAKALAGTPLEGHVFASADLETLVQLVTFDAIVTEVAQRFDLDPDKLLEFVEIFPQDRSRVITVRAFGDDAEGAAELANAYLDTALGHYRRDFALELERAAEHVAARMDSARERVERAQSALSAFVGQHDFSDESELPKIIDRVRDTERRVGQLEARRAAIAMQLEKLAELIDKEEKVVRSVSSSRGGAGGDGGFWDRYRAADGEASPWLSAARPKRGTTTSTVAPNPVHQALYMAGLELETESASLDVEIERASQELERAQALQTRLPVIKQRFQTLMLERDHALTVLDDALSAASAVAAVQRQAEPLFQVLERAAPPRKPERTRRLVLGALALFVGGALAFGWGLLAELADDQVREPVEIERLGVPVVARVRLEGTTLDARGQEAIEQAAYALRRHGRMHGPQCILITSAGPEEGKTRLAREVARVLVEWGESVLRIDANFHDATGQPGHLERYLSGQAEQPSLLKFRNGLYAITCSGTRADAPALLASDWMDRLLDRARASFSLCVVDGPAMAPGVDAALLVEKVDAVFLVVRAGSVGLRRLRRTIGELQGHGVHVLGAVLVDALDPAARIREEVA